MKRNLSTLYACSLLLVALCSGCKKEEPQQASPATPPPAQPPQAPPQQAAQPQAAVQKPLSSARSAGLDFRKRTDPFKPHPAALPPVKGQTPEKAERPLGEDQLPIQSFEVTKFKVAGIIAGLRENRALLIDPNGKGYVVQQGMLIGNNNGRITRITANSVEVVESIREETGRARKRTIVLTLTKKR